jgi:nucleoside 2-deoxyribosyltransferase
MKDVYIAGTLLHAKKDQWKIYEKIADKLEKIGMASHIPHIHTAKGKDIHAPVGSPNEPNPVDAYRTNLEVIKNAKLIVAEVSNPSLGTGIEIGIAMQLKKPIICLAKNDALVTRMIRGAGELGLLSLIRYGEEEEGLNKLVEEIKKMEL